MWGSEVDYKIGESSLADGCISYHDKVVEAQRDAYGVYRIALRLMMQSLWMVRLSALKWVRQPFPRICLLELMRMKK